MCAHVYTHVCTYTRARAYIHVYVCVHIHVRVCMRTHTHSEILLSHEKNEIMLFAATCVDLEMIILSEVRQRKTRNMIPFICGI